MFKMTKNFCTNEKSQLTKGNYFHDMNKKVLKTMWNMWRSYKLIFTY